MFKRAFDGKYSYLTEEIQLSQGLWQALKTSKVLSEEQIETCTNELRHPSRADKVAKLLEFLERKDDAKFTPFLQALKDHDNEKVAAVLQGSAQGNNAIPVTSTPQLPVPPPSQSANNASSSTGKCHRCGAREHDTDFPWMFKCFITTKRLGLIEHLEVGGNFYASLLQKRILSDRDIAEIKGNKDEYTQKEELLKQLEKCDDDKMDPFRQVLEDNNGEQIAKLIRKYFPS